MPYYYFARHAIDAASAMPHRHAAYTLFAAVQLMPPMMRHHLRPQRRISPPRQYMNTLMPRTATMPVSWVCRRFLPRPRPAWRRGAQRVLAFDILRAYF